MKQIKMVLMILLILWGTGLMRGQEEKKLSLTFSGGPVFITGGDMKDWFNGSRELYTWMGSQAGYSVHQDFEFESTALTGQLDVQYKINSHWSIGLGIGYFKKSWAPNATVGYDYGGEMGSDTTESAMNINMNVIPVTLTGLVSFPVSDQLKWNIMTGCGIYLISFDFKEEISHSWPAAPNQSGYVYNYNWEMDENKAALGIHLGTGLEWKISSSLSLVFDILYRLASATDIMGDRNWEETVRWEGYSDQDAGTDKDQILWFGKTTQGGNSHDQGVFSEKQPEELQSPSEFVFKLSGLTLKLGIKIFF